MMLTRAQKCDDEENKEWVSIVVVVVCFLFIFRHPTLITNESTKEDSETCEEGR
jgi:hypothetical protein